MPRTGGWLHEQRLQIERKHADGGLLRALGQIAAQLILQRGRDQAAVGVPRGRLHQRRGGAARPHIQRAHFVFCLLRVHLQADLQKALGLAAVHRQHAMGSHQAHGFLILIIHAVYAVLFLRSPRAHLGRAQIKRLELGAHARIVAHALGQNVHRPRERGLLALHTFFFAEKRRGQLLGRLALFRLQLQNVAQRFQALFPGDHRARAALGAVRPVNVLQFAHRARRVQRALQFLRPHFQLLQRGGDLFAPGFQRAQLR